MKTSFLAGLLFALFAVPAFAGAVEPIVPTDAVIDAELRNREIAASLAPIKSRGDLQRYLAATPAHLDPLSRLSPAGKQRFLDSLVFNDAGALAGFRYGDLRSAPGMSLMADHAGYACVSRANCYQSPGFICMSGC